MVDDADVIPELDPSVASMIGAYAAETAREPARVEAALARVTAKVGAGTSVAVAGGGISVAKIGLVTALVGAVALAGYASLDSAAPRETPAAAVPPVQDPGPALEAGPRRPAPAPAVAAIDDVAELHPHAPAGEDVEQAPPARQPRRRHTGAVPKPRTAVAAESKRDAALPGPANAESPAALEAEASLAAELTALRQLRTALRGGQAARALKLAAEHRRSYPASTFAEERDATEIAALCALGRGDAARGKAAAYARRFPRSTRDVLGNCRELP